MDMNDVELKMMKAVETMDSRLLNIRAGRANPAMLNGIQAEYYGTPTPIQSLANITVPEARQLFIKPFDKSALKDIERAINEANLGITPTNNGEMIILTIPELNEERRREYVKQAKQKLYLEDIQELTNKYNKIIEEKIKEKEEELMQV